MSNQKTKRRLIIAAIIVFTVFAVVAGAIIILFNGRFLKKNTQTGSDDGKLNSDIVTPAEIKDKNVNILIVGIDDDAQRDQVKMGQRTDTVMIVSYDIANQKVDVLQIPRDTFIGDEVSTGKINEVYGKKGGIEGLANQLNKMFKITLDHYATVNMDGFVTIVDKIGGVEVDVPEVITVDEVTINKGPQVLNGAQAQAFVRNRDYAMADIRRMEMQKLFMQSFFKKVTTLKYSDILAVAPIAIKEVGTDLNLSELLGFYKKITGLDFANIKFHSLPIERATYNGLEVLNLNKQKTAQLLNDNFRTYTDKVDMAQLNIKSATPKK
ncbi:MAG: LCP family protein [Oscillospiraceae bacterium]